MDLLQALALIGAVWLAGAALFVLLAVPNCPHTDDDPVDPIPRNLRNIHGDRGTSL